MTRATAAPAMDRVVPVQARSATRALLGLLGDALRGVVLYGSHVAGGLRPRSDLDLLAVLRGPLDETTRHALMRALLDLSAPPGDPDHRALEVTCVVEADIRPWRYPARRELQFGEWLRADIEAGFVASAVEDPDLALLLAQARAQGIPLHGDAPDVLLPEVPQADIRGAILAMRPEVARNLVGEELHALLTLARMWVAGDRRDRRQGCRRRPCAGAAAGRRARTADACTRRVPRALRRRLVRLALPRRSLRRCDVRGDAG
ncbi:putative nucleotidyltransferase [Luteimonas terrae]|uniref:Aminoglycoside (3'') (9) adenylyltransferase n=1 Tax=Luteimonas terrae TaxID=1530191 RepID=A0ABU1XUZ1_9GAMM|nr:aminoglycoside adenylyltransferase family protein [Luteimonas terrae]MDR7192050.1 putative nucleotidyltransferase [Luteimonas terrae]